MRRRLLMLALLPALLTYIADAQGSSAALAKYGPSGVRALDDTAFVWNTRGAAAGLWRLDDTTSGVHWTALPLPRALQQEIADEVHEEMRYASSPENVQTPFDLEVQNGTPRLFWFHEDPQSASTGEHTSNLIEAASPDRGLTWTILSSSTSTTPGLSFVQSFIASDAQHAWLLARSDPGASQLPQALFTTSDAGRHWLDRRGSNSALPLGIDGPHLLHAISANRAWLIGTCPPCTADQSIAAAWTTNGGQTWRKAQIAFDSNCPECEPVSIAETPSRPDCFDLLDANGRSETQFHFCTPDDGATWNGPLPGFTIKPLIYSKHAGRFLWPMYAPENGRIGVAANCQNLPATAPAAQRHKACELVATTNAGRSWRSILPDVTSELLHPIGLSASGIGAWLLVSGEPNQLFHSTDAGRTWSAVSATGR
ncbi:MAG TPA: hypothetical protein VLI45_10690 [Acidobacteriaceae bacterium]|nr:hypothetical protein [Acidobacteriaceae bacterium]